MTLDKEEHRQILIQTMEQMNFPGKFAEEVAALLNALRIATIEEQREKQLRKVP